MPDLEAPPLPGMVLLLPAAACSAAIQAAVAELDDVEIQIETRAASSDWRKELQQLRAEFGQRALLRVYRANLWLAADALQRLLKGAAGHSGALTPMTNMDLELTPVAPDCKLDATDPALIDAAVFALSAHRCFEVHVERPALLYLPADADAHSTVAVLDNVYVQAPDVPLVGKPTPADRRERAPAHPLARLRLQLQTPALTTINDWSQATRDDRPVVLHILHGWGGGAERFVHDLASSDNLRQHLLLRAISNPGRRQHGEFLELSAARGGAVLRRHLLTPAIGAIVDHHTGYAALLSQLIDEFAVEQIWISSLIGHALEALRTPLPLRWIAHDYFPFWPALHRDFGAAQARFDGVELARDVEQMRAGPFGQSDPHWWATIAASTSDLLQHATLELVAPDASVLRNLSKVAPALAGLTQRCIAHGTASWPNAAKVRAELATIEPKLHGGQRFRLLVLGRINGAKGLQLLQALLPRLGDAFDVFLIGAGKAAEALFGVSGAHVLMDYTHADLPEILSRIRPHAALLPSTVSETFSYTLSELWDLGIPPIATRLGAYAERIKHGHDGILVEPNCQQIEILLKALSADLQPLQDIRRVLSQRVSRGLSDMVGDYDALLPQGRRASLRYAMAAASPSDLQQSLLADAVNDQQLQLTKARSQIVEQDTELVRRAHWGFDLGKLVDERTRWAQSLDHELTRTRQWLNERERQHQQAVDAANAATDAERRQMEARMTALTSEMDARISGLALEHEIAMEAAQTAADALKLRIGELNQVQEQLRLQQIAAAQLMIEHSRLQDRLQLIQRERDILGQHRAEMIASTSWRLTMPLRVFGRFMKRVRASLRFRTTRLLSLIGRLRGSVARRGLRGTWARAQLELKTQSQRPSNPQLVEHPSPTGSLSSFSLPNCDQPRVSVIVPVYNQLHHTWQCLEALAATCGDHALEVIVVDDGSSDDTATEVPRIKGVRFHRNPENLGFIGACNAGAALARGEYLFFLNNDTAVQPNWLAPLLRSFEEFSNVGLVGSKLVYPDGRLQEAGGIVFNDGSGWNYGRFDHPDDPRYDYPREADYCSGAAILIRKSLFDQFGGFDSYYKPAYYEDTDLAFKVRAAGLRVIYQPASRVIHFEGITGGTDTSSGTKRYQVINQGKFLQRWKDDLQWQPTPTDHAGIYYAATHRARGRILLIDATTPTPDQDSGSVRYINLIKVLRSIGWQCTFFADNRAYVPGYTDALRALGVEVQFHPWLSDPVSFFRERGAHFDAIMISRHYVACQYVELVREHAPQALLLFDTVDLHYLREQRAAAVSGSESLVRQAESTRKAELNLIQRCDVTLVVSPVERDLLAQEAPGQRVEVLSNIHEVAGRRADFASRKDIWFVGGFQHQPNIDAVQWFAKAIWPRVRAALPELRFHIVGSKITHDIEVLAGNGIEVHGFVKDIQPYLDGCRMSVAPLRYGAGVKGKVNQSMAYGQPVVATPMAVEGMEIIPGNEALVADRADDFADAVIRLYQDPELWLRLSDAGLANIQTHFSFEAARDALAGILERRKN